MSIKTRPISNNPSFDLWRDGLATDARNMRGATWKLIRRLGEGRANYGDELFWQAVHDTSLSESTVTNYLSLFNLYFVPAETFRVNVPVAIHETIRTLDAEQRATVLEVAEKLGWTRENVRERMQAFKAGDTKAWDPRWKAHKAPKLSIQTPADDESGPAGGTDLNSSKDDTPVMDGTSVGAVLSAEARAEERREVLAAISEQSLSTANQRLLAVIATLKAMRSDPDFLKALDAEGLNADAIRLEAQWLINTAGEISNLQSINWNRSSARKAAPAKAGAEGGDVLQHASPPENPVAKASEDESDTTAHDAASAGDASRENDGSGSVVEGSRDVEASGGATAALTVSAQDFNSALGALTAAEPDGDGSVPRVEPLPVISTTSTRPASTGVRTEDDLEIPAFLDRRGHA